MWRRTVYGCVQLLSLSFLLPGGGCFHIKKSSTVADSVPIPDFVTIYFIVSLNMSSLALIKRGCLRNRVNQVPFQDLPPRQMFVKTATKSANQPSVYETVFNFFLY